MTVSDGEDERTRTVTVTVFGADDPEARFRVLVFSKTTGFRHDSIDEGIAAIRQLGEANDFQVDATEDPSVFNDDALAHYDAVVFMSTTGDPLNADAADGVRELHPRLAAVTWASTPRPTPSTSGRSTASSSARTSRAIRPARRPRRCGSTTPITTRRGPPEPVARVWTSGTTTSRR